MMKKILLPMFLVLFVACFVQAQSGDSIEFKVLDPPAQYPGGYQAFYKFLGDNMKYPQGKDLKGKVYVEFIIGADGAIEDSSVRTLSKDEIVKMNDSFKINNSYNDMIEDDAFSQEAIRVIKLCPDWKPGLHKGVPSRQRMVVPLVFSP